MQAFKHNNISAIKAHEQFVNDCDLMSIPEKKIKDVRNGCFSSIEDEMKANKMKVVEKKHELDEVKQRFNAVEEKWFKNEISKRYL